MEDVYGPEYRPAKTVQYAVAEHKKITDTVLKWADFSSVSAIKDCMLVTTYIAVKIIIITTYLVLKQISYLYL